MPCIKDSRTTKVGFHSQSPTMSRTVHGIVLLDVRFLFSITFTPYFSINILCTQYFFPLKLTLFGPLLYHKCLDSVVLDRLAGWIQYIKLNMIRINFFYYMECEWHAVGQQTSNNSTPLPFLSDLCVLLIQNQNYCNRHI